MRQPALQHLLDAAETAILACDQASPAAQRAAALCFDRLRETTGTANMAAPETLPVCSHLPDALAQAKVLRPDVAQAFSALLPDLRWGRRKSARPEDGAFYDGHANAMLVGPGGLEQRADVWVGTTLIAPDVTYPDHDHPPEEVYLSLTPGAWWNAVMDWNDPGARGLIYNPPGIRHAMRASHRAFLALWLLPV